MVNYQNGKIYKIVSNQSNMVYFGSTTVALTKRLSIHNAHYKGFSKKSADISSFDIIELGHAQIFLVESFPCNSKEELIARKRFHIESNCCVNRQIPGRQTRRNA
eukprot:Lithocolla_globosa_v1_NODE_2634_length_1926_cov_7.330305.p1 type:complete len:105 gc:universal NODE_2634_length_1926_cov_7.330305:1422-1736(+)